MDPTLTGQIDAAVVWRFGIFLRTAGCLREPNAYCEMRWFVAATQATGFAPGDQQTMTFERSTITNEIEDPKLAVATAPLNGKNHGTGIPSSLLMVTSKGS